MLFESTLKPNNTFIINAIDILNKIQTGKHITKNILQNLKSIYFNYKRWYTFQLVICVKSLMSYI